MLAGATATWWGAGRVRNDIHALLCNDITAMQRHSARTKKFRRVQLTDKSADKAPGPIPLLGFVTVREEGSGGATLPMSPPLVAMTVGG